MINGNVIYFVASLYFTIDILVYQEINRIFFLGFIWSLSINLNIYICSVLISTMIYFSTNI